VRDVLDEPEIRSAVFDSVKKFAEELDDGPTRDALFSAFFRE